MKKLIFVLLVFFLFVKSVPAQEKSLMQIKDIGGSVSFTLQAQTSNQSNVTQIPVELLDTLTKVSYLKHFQFNTGKDSHIFTALFVFTNYDSFKKWYSAEETQSLLKKLTEYFNGKLNEKFSFTRN